MSKDAPSNAGELVGERDGEDVVMQSPLGRLEPRLEAVALRAVADFSLETALDFRAIIMEHHGCLFDMDDAKNRVMTLYCYRRRHAPRKKGTLRLTQRYLVSAGRA